MNHMYSFCVPGVPVPKGRPRVTRYGTYTPPRTQEYEARVLAAWENLGKEKIPLGTPVEVRVYAHMPIPKSVSKKKATDLNAKPHTSHRADIDNIAKSVLDALNGHAFEDDCCVWRLDAVKMYAYFPLTAVFICWSDENEEND